MIRIIKAIKEYRKRDKERRRFILMVGNCSWHITVTEAKRLLRDLEGVLQK